MAYKMKSSGLPFKELGSSPAKQVTAKTDSTRVAKPITPKLDPDQNAPIVTENEWIAPQDAADYTKEFFNKSSKGKKKGKLKAMRPVEKKGVKEGAAEATTQLATNKAKRTLTNKMRTKKPTGDTIGTPKMNPPYKKPVGPRERPHPGKGESSGFENFKSNITKPKTKEGMDAFIAGQLETEGSDERETERINP